ncbi:MAG: hypothetical protein ACOZFS_05940 [Thermodesulfobacteriota bacterium]
MPPPWKEVEAKLLPGWIREHPGTRPFGWWAEEAPEARLQVGGGECTPNPMYEAHGLPIPGHWNGDPGDPPLYESQAAYLQRLGLLTPLEKKWLAGHREALEPVTLKYERIGMGLSNEAQEDH